MVELESESSSVPHQVSTDSEPQRTVWSVLYRWINTVNILFTVAATPTVCVWNGVVGG